MRFGQYPEVVKSVGEEEKIIYLQETVEANLYKDILQLENIRNSDLLRDLLTLLSFEIGREVSLNKLANNLDVAKETIKCYLDLLEKAVIIISLSGFGRNLRKEVSKSSKYYFVDLWVRNTVINNFDPLSLSNDKGMFWENFLLSNLSGRKKM